MRSKLMTMQEAVQKYTWDGMTYAHGGALPVGTDSIAYGREMLKQGRKDLNVISNCNTQQTNLLAAAGRIKRIEIGFSGLEVYGFANGLKRAVESGMTVLEDYSNGSIPLRMLAGALNMPFIPANASFGSDQEYCCGDRPAEYPCSTKVPKVKDPFSGKDVFVYPAIRPEAASIHVTMADIYGNAIMLGTEWNRYELSRSAGKVVLQADFIVDTDCMRQFPNLVRIPDAVVDAVVYWPYGAWPQCSVGVYDSDEKAMKEMNAALKTAEGTEEYIKKFVTSYSTVQEWIDLLGKERVDMICNTVTKFLMDPYRRWVKSDTEIQQMLDRR
jgi:glutaconate CoA-transferase subunit A